MSIDAKVGIPFLKAGRQISPQPRRRERIEISPFTLAQNEHGKHHEQNGTWQLFAHQARKQPRPVIAAPTQARDALGGRKAFASLGLARHGRGHFAFRLGKQQVGRIELEPVAMKASVGVARRRTGCQNLVSRLEQIIYDAGEPVDTHIVKARHVFEHHQKRTFFLTAQIGGHLPVVQIPQKARAFPVHPEHAEEREHRFRILERKLSFPEPVGGNKEPRNVALAQKPRDEVGAWNKMGCRYVFRPTSFTGGRFEKRRHGSLPLQKERGQSEKQKT